MSGIHGAEYIAVISLYGDVYMVYKNTDTYRHFSLVSDPASYFGDIGFECRPVDQLSGLRFV
jgi:hypothetical protein